MKEEKIFNAITEVPDELIEEAKNTPLRQKSKQPWLKWAAAAACMVLIITAVLNLPALKQSDTPPTTDTPSTADTPPTAAPTEPVTFDSQLIYQPLYKVTLPKAYSMYESRVDLIAQNPVEDTFLSSLTNFSYKTASEVLKASKGNINFSPLSLYYALSLATAGAEGKTAEELNNLLGVSDKQTLLTQGGNLYRRLYSDNELAKIKVANSLWINNLAGIRQDFVKNAAESFYAESYNIDYKDIRTKELMKSWVKDNTGGTVTPVIELDPNELMSIMNTIYFSAQWTDKFDEKDTKKGVFYTDGKTQVKCDFMRRDEAESMYYKGSNFTRATLGLSTAHMTFVLPDEGVSLDEFLSSEASLKSALEGGEENMIYVNWQLPKFSFGSEVELKEPLKKLGVNTAFSGEADFRGISSEKAFITSLSQNTHIGIDETGVTAAAFTSLGYGMGGPEQKYADMILNRPFIFAIYTGNGTPLFMGVCRNPAQS
ncbi:MAG: serpin family protein [Acutalibacteraceae bacterium]